MIIRRSAATHSRAVDSTKIEWFRVTIKLSNTYRKRSTKVLRIRFSCYSQSRWQRTAHIGVLLCGCSCASRTWTFVVVLHPFFLLFKSEVLFGGFKVKRLCVVVAA